MSVGRVIVVSMSYYFDDLGVPRGPAGPPDWGDDDELDEYSSWDDDPRGRVPALSLDPAQQAGLAAAVERGLRERGCDNTLRSAQEWAAREGVGWAGLQAQLEGHGGYCDCEVLLNVLPGDDPEPD